MRAMCLFLRLLIPALFFQSPVWAQEEEFDIPPPPPIIEDYEEPMIEPMVDEIPMDEMVDGPIYEAPPEDGMIPPPDFDPNNLPPANNAPPPARMGFSGPDPRSPVRGQNPAVTGNRSFGQTEGAVKFEVVEGVFWEKGKKRTRGERR